jgi:hypothetical protein
MALFQVILQSKTERYEAGSKGVVLPERNPLGVSLKPTGY